MTREELIYEVCPYKSMIDCHSEEPYTHFKCKDCSILMNNWFDEYDKHVIKQYKADTNLKDTIKDIHDNVAQEMYCKGIDDLTEKLKEMANNSSTKYIRLSEKETITTYGVEQIAEELKAGDNE